MFWMNATANNSDIIQLTASAKISIDGSNVITTTGLTNATIYVNGISGSTTATGTYYLVTITFDSLDCDAVIFGYSSSRYTGQLDESRFYTKKLSASEILGTYKNGDGDQENNVIRVIDETGSGNLIDNTPIVSELDITDDTEIDVINVHMHPSFTCGINDEAIFIDDTGTTIFTGLIRQIKFNGADTDAKKLIIRSYESQLQDRIVTQIWNNTTPEAIIESIVTTYSNMTYSSTYTSGITIGKFSVRNKYAWDVIKDLIDRIQGLTYNVNASKVFSLFLKGSAVAPQQIINYSNSVIEGWTQDDSRQVTRLTLIGDKEIIDKTTTDDGDGSTLEFNIYEKFLSMKVEVDSGACFVEQTPQVDGATTGQYVLDKDNKKVRYYR